MQPLGSNWPANLTSTPEGGGGGEGLEGTCYVVVPGDVPFSWVYFLPKAKAGHTICPKILK